METVVTEKPLSLATSRMVTADPLALFKPKLLPVDVIVCGPVIHATGINAPFGGAPTWGEFNFAEKSKAAGGRGYALCDEAPCRSFPPRHAIEPFFYWYLGCKRW